MLEDMTKVYASSKTTFARQNISTPRFYVRYLVELEDFINEMSVIVDCPGSLARCL